MIELSELAKNLKFFEDGIWISRNNSLVSYPEYGNTLCFRLEDNSFWFRHRNNCLITVFKRFPPEGALLDIGGGNGYVSLGLKDNGFDTILVEPGIEGVRNARLRGLNPVICATLEDAEFKDGTIPSAGIFDVLEHIEDDMGFLKKIKSLLIRNGRLYLTVPAYNILWSVDDDIAGHYRRYALKDLTGKLELCGYKIDYATYFFSILLLPIFFFRTIPTKIGLRGRDLIKQVQKECNPKLGILSYPLDWYLQRELSRIKKDKIGFGASLLIVARSKNG